MSCVLEFLYKGDYAPRLLRSRDHANTTTTWELETTHPHGPGSTEAIIHLPDGPVLRDTAVYCAAEKHGLEALKRLALRKQGLHAGISIDVILRSARYAYDHTSDAEYRLRAHYLAMIIRTRHIFKSSGTMQAEMELGHPFFFDLFVAMCNHMDDLEETRLAPGLDCSERWLIQNMKQVQLIQDDLDLVHSLHRSNTKRQLPNPSKSALLACLLACIS